MPAKKKTTVTKPATTIRRRTPSAAAATAGIGLSFRVLVDAIRRVHEQCAAQASRAVNLNLTLRNWVIGGYIHHYELNGRDRAKYGAAMIDRLAAELAKRGVSACERQRLYSYLAFFRTYPQIADAIPNGTLPSLRLLLEPDEAAIFRSATGKSDADPAARIVRSVTGQLHVTGGRYGQGVAGSAVLHPSRITDGHRRPAQACLLRDRVHPWQLVCKSLLTLWQVMPAVSN